MKTQLLLVVAALLCSCTSSQAQRYSVPSKRNPKISPSATTKQLNYLTARLKRFQFLRKNGHEVPQKELKKVLQQLDALSKSQSSKSDSPTRPRAEMLSQKPYALLLAPRLR